MKLDRKSEGGRGGGGGSGESPPSGYMQTIMSKIINNVHINFENVIVKYVEEDIVLSVNVTHASYCTADEDWEPAFVGIPILSLAFIFSKIS
jgi:vacuolar protein sorting-associated protein 13B